MTPPATGAASDNYCMGHEGLLFFYPRLWLSNGCWTTNFDSPSELRIQVLQGQIGQYFEL